MPSTLLETYPDRDVAAILARPPTSRPFTVVADADELIREVVYRVRRGNDPLLLSLAGLGWARLFATDRVGEEVERNLPKHAGRDQSAALEAWRAEYLPLIRWVSMPDRSEVGFAVGEDPLQARMSLVMERHDADAPTAELALMCAPCFVITRNGKHLHVAGFGDSATRKAIAAAGNKAELELTGLRAVSLAELGGEALWGAGRRAFKLAADSPLLGALMVVGVIFLAQMANERRGQIRAAGRRFRDVSFELADQLVNHHHGLVAALAPSLVLALEEPTDAIQVAGRLARAPAPRSAEVIATGLELDRDGVLEALRAHQAFSFWPGQGWTLGRHFP
jgi:hypothetical protein